MERSALVKMRTSSKDDTNLKQNGGTIMFLKPIEQVVDFLVAQAKKYGQGCNKVYVSLSGGVDSAVVAMILVRAFGADNVVTVYRDIRSDPQHKIDAQDLSRALGFRLICLDLNDIYDQFLSQAQVKMSSIGIAWSDEQGGGVWTNAYASLKSRMMTPFAGFISKAIDDGNGRIFGTGNLEEDYLLRYFDKFGDGAVDNNILVGLTKMEVRQIALWFGRQYNAAVCKRIAEKLPSADLQANGNVHNDENELSQWARQRGYNIELSYGSCTQEGNIAWICKQDLDLGVIRGKRMRWTKALTSKLGYTDVQVQLTLFMREIEKVTRHKALGIPGVNRRQLRKNELVD